MRLLHWMGEGDGRRYRVWSTVSDTYYGEPMTEAELRASGLVVSYCPAADCSHADPILLELVHEDDLWVEYRGACPDEGCGRTVELRMGK